MYSLTQDALQAILSTSFAVFGFFLITVMLIAKTVSFFLNRFTKKKVKLSKSSSFIPIVGTCFIVTLSIIANNFFTYTIAIIIIATLITELEFLEKLIALLWNRNAYWQYQEWNIISKLPQGSTAESPEEKKELAGIEKKLEETPQNTSTTSIDNSWFLQFHSERVYRLIFGSQIGILQWLRLQDQKGVNRRDLEQAYSANPISKIYPFESYMNFLTMNALIQYNPITTSYYILPVGKYFLMYIEENNIPTNKPN